VIQVKPNLPTTTTSLTASAARCSQRDPAAGAHRHLYLSGSHQTYWGTGNADEQLQAGLNAAVDDINWTLSYSLTKNAWQQGRDQMLAVNVNIPFSHWLRSDSNRSGGTPAPATACRTI
jgi:outer membrane usher protein FimD/PapC